MTHLPAPLAALVIFSLAVAANGQPPAKSEFIEGTWKHRGVRDILGGGQDTEISLHRKANAWTISLRHRKFPRLCDEERMPVDVTEGPFAVTAEGGVLQFLRGEKLERYSFQADEQRLVMPAFVEQEPGVWIFVSPRDSLQIKLEHPHLKEPLGRASFPGVVNDNGYYTFEEAPRSRAWPSTQYLRLLTRAKDGRLVEQARLIFDDYGWPRYERLLSTGERSRNDFQIEHYFAASEDD